MVAAGTAVAESVDYTFEALESNKVAWKSN